MYDSGANRQVFNVWLPIPFQLLRGVRWALFALPIIDISDLISRRTWRPLSTSIPIIRTRGSAPNSMGLRLSR